MDESHAEVQEETLGAKAGLSSVRPLSSGQWLFPLVELEILLLEMELVSKQPSKHYECYIMM